jgi:hypothetical protein
LEVFNKLIQSSNSVVELESYLDVHLDELYDCLLSQDYHKLKDNKSLIESYILSKYRVIKDLDPKKTGTFVFYTILLSVCERFGYLLSFQRLRTLLLKSNYNVGSRLKAASLYLVGIKTADDYLTRYSDIYDQLKYAYDHEEDNVDAVLATIVNFYSHLVRNFGDTNIQVVKALKFLLEQSIAEDEHSFLNHPLLFQVLNIDLTLPQYAYISIQNILDTYLGRTTRELFLSNELLLERETEYCASLQACEPSLNSIRQLSIKQYSSIPNSRYYFESLKRGVKVLTEVQELYAYMVGFGPMHFNKLNSAFHFLPKEFFNKQLDIIDWGCGQGIATSAFLEYVADGGFDMKINTVQLIEPSKIALERAALHVIKLAGQLEISTINKYFDSLENIDFDFHKLKAQVHLHLFSNILDIDLFSLSKLINLIKGKFSGQNYFICVSPYVNDLKTNRIDRFVNAFKDENEFELLKSINNRKGEWSSNENWTRVLRVFKASLN